MWETTEYPEYQRDACQLAVKKSTRIILAALKLCRMK
jgi:hypothetical protein